MLITQRTTGCHSLHGKATHWDMIWYDRWWVKLCTQSKKKKSLCVCKIKYTNLHVTKSVCIRMELLKITHTQTEPMCYGAYRIDNADSVLNFGFWTEKRCVFIYLFIFNLICARSGSLQHTNQMPYFHEFRFGLVEKTARI